MGSTSHAGTSEVFIIVDSHAQIRSIPSYIALVISPLTYRLGVSVPFSAKVRTLLILVFAQAPGILYPIEFVSRG